MGTFLEIRRHSIRSSGDVHLSQEGVSLARLVGERLGPFERVITSTLPRAFDTAIAMGFAVDEQVELMSSYPDEIDLEVPYPQTFAAYAAAARCTQAAGRYAAGLAGLYRRLAVSLPEGGTALIINHGGILELGVTGCLPDYDYESWGGPAGYCEGARLSWEEDEFVDAQLLRIR